MATVDYWEHYFGTGSPVFQVPNDEEEMEEFRSEKSVKTGKVRSYGRARLKSNKLYRRGNYKFTFHRKDIFQVPVYVLHVCVHLWFCL